LLHQSIDTIHYTCTILIGFWYLHPSLYFGRNGGRSACRLRKYSAGTIEVWERMKKYKRGPEIEGTEALNATIIE
jgi:hypothetical protein